MTVGWNLTVEAEYNVPFDAGLTPLQQKFFNELLQAYAPAVDGALPDLQELLRRLCQAHSVRFNEAAACKIIFLAKLHLEGYGVFSYFLQDDDLEEVAVVGLDQPVFVCHRTRGWLKTNVVVTQLDFAMDLVNKMSRFLGRRLTFQTPRLNAVLEDGSRLHACIAPVTKNGFSLTLRKFRRNRFRIQDLLDGRFLTVDQATFLSLVMETDASLLIAGNTASGKTTLLNALSEFVPTSERVIVIEETPELQWPHEHQVRLVESLEVGASLQSLAWDSLRMRPDRIVLGEIRTQTETQALFDVLLSGHAKGAYATFHADSAAEALVRLTSLGARQQDLAALDVIVVARRSLAGRRLTECVVVSNGQPIPVFSRNGFSPGFFSSPFFIKQIAGRKEFGRLWQRRKQAFQNSSQNSGVSTLAP